MAELGDLVVFTSWPKNLTALQKLAATVAYKKLRQKISCGIVIGRFNRDKEEILRIIFPEGSYTLDVEQVMTISKWYVSSDNKL